MLEGSKLHVWMSSRRSILTCTVIGNIMLTSANGLVAMPCTLLSVREKTNKPWHTYYLGNFVLHRVVEFQVGAVCRWHRRDVLLIFPRNAMSWVIEEEDRDWGLFQPVWFCSHGGMVVVSPVKIMLREIRNLLCTTSSAVRKVGMMNMSFCDCCNGRRVHAVTV